MSLKSYKCANCGHEMEIDTNHYGECYSCGDSGICVACNATPTIWQCTAEVPKGEELPSKWKTVVMLATEHEIKTKTQQYHDSK